MSHLSRKMSTEKYVADFLLNAQSALTFLLYGSKPEESISRVILLGTSFSYTLISRCTHAHLKLPYSPGFDTITGGIHGGIIASLLESAGWYAVAAQNEGIWTATSHFNIHLLNPAQKTELYADGWVLKSGKRISVAEMKVFTPDGKLIATGSGTYVVLESIPLIRDPG